MPLSVIEVRPVGKVSGSVEVGKAITGEERRPYQVTFNGPGATIIDAINANDGTLGIPPFGATSGVLVLKSKTGDMLPATPNIWTVTCIYSYPTPGEESRPDDDSEKWAVTITRSSAPFEKPLQKHPDGTFILNTAKEHIQNLKDKDDDEEILVEFTTVAIDYDSIDACMNRVNDADITITENGVSVLYPAGTLKFDSYTNVYTTDVDGEQYPRVTLKLIWRRDGWVRHIANLGFNKRVGGKLLPIEPHMTTPAALNADGTGKLADGAAVLTVDVDPFTADFTSLLAEVEF